MSNQGAVSQPQESEGEGEEARAAAFEEYCAAVEGSAAWGGQLELTALSAALQRHIAVYSIGMPRVDMGLHFRGVRRRCLH